MRYLEFNLEFNLELKQGAPMSLNIYLTFNGNCREVFEHYKSVFGGDFIAFQTFGDAPPDMDIADGDKDKVMHVSLPVGSSTLMGSDSAQGPGAPVVVGTNFSISIVGESKHQCDDLFDKISRGGEVMMAMQETFWGSYFGMCRDRYGINWMINLDMGEG